VSESSEVPDEIRRLLRLAPETPVTNKQLEAALDSRPLCCRLTVQQLEALYAESLGGETRRCVVCRRRGLGGPMLTANLGKLPHVCFRCVASSRSHPPGAS